MKIVFVVGSLSGGGAERVVSLLSDELAKQGHIVTIILIASYEQSYAVSDSIKIEDCSRENGIKGFRFVNRIKHTRQIIKDVSPDIIVSFTVAVNVYTILAKMGINNKLVVAERNDPRFDPVDKLTRIARKILYPFADYFVFQTDGEKNYFSKKIQRRSTIIPNPINPLLPMPYNAPKEKRIVTATRLVPQKNLYLLIDAFKESCAITKGYRLDIYGNGPLYHDLLQYIKDNHLTDVVYLHGNVPNIYDQILKASVFVLPSNYEGISNSMIEAMGLGIPTISTDYPSGGARMFIKNNISGLLFPVGDKAALINAIDKLINDDKLQSLISKNCIYVRDQLEVTKITNQWIEMLELLCRNNA